MGRYGRSRRGGVKPALDEAPLGQRALWAAAITATSAVLLLLAFRIALQLDVRQLWVLPALAAGILAADFASGLIHWAADTWGRDDLPIIGKRLLVPFRVHHVNPDDFLRRRFLDTNGDVALLVLPIAAACAVLPIETTLQAAAALFGLGLCATGLMTNQLHQWAHLPVAPRPVRWLQTCRLVLSREAHARHHRFPYDRQYCITTGWCNRTLEAVGFFRRVERLITRWTGAHARADDNRYEARYAVAGFDSRRHPLG